MLSVTDRCRDGAVMATIMHLGVSSLWSILLTFRSVALPPTIPSGGTLWGY
jgi:hypothetical protein